MFRMILIRSTLTVCKKSEDDGACLQNILADLNQMYINIIFKRQGSEYVPRICGENRKVFNK